LVDCSERMVALRASMVAMARMDVPPEPLAAPQVG
jgi:hypothetical protein